MKALILSVSDKRHMSMIAPYEEYFSKNKIAYDIIRIARYNDEYTSLRENGINYEFPIHQSTDNNKLKKLIPFLKFRNFAKKIINKEKYDFIVVWNENTAVLFADVLLFSKVKYCVNVRDLFELPILLPIFNSVVKNSYFATCPSPADGLGNREWYITLFNRDTRIYENVPAKTSFKKKGERIVITFMGLYASAGKTFRKTVDVFGNDSRYELRFYGDGFETTLEEYVKEKGYSNIITGGAFPYEKTYEYLAQTDIINSYYNNFDTCPNLATVSGVKQSYTPMLYLPAINDENTTWGEISKEYGFSFLINDDNLQNAPDELYNWYYNLDFEKFKNDCDRFNSLVDNSRNEIFELLDIFFGNSE